MVIWLPRFALSRIFTVRRNNENYKKLLCVIHIVDKTSDYSEKMYADI